MFAMINIPFSLKIGNHLQKNNKKLLQYRLTYLAETEVTCAALGTVFGGEIVNGFQNVVDIQ